MWNGAVAGNPLDGDPAFSIGPTAGGGAVWMASDKAAVLRLGEKTGPAHIEPVWADAFANPPFTGDAPQYTAAGYNGTGGASAWASAWLRKPAISTAPG